ncbi:MAG: hypothetical protein SFW65_00475 [Alphaproteobacteria bacterium]|nr:hypothetical protein [Alphaproteobacteria bacterium]
MPSKPASISPDTLLFMEARAICLMNERGRESFLAPSPALIQTIARRLGDYAAVIDRYGSPPAMIAAWERISNDTGSSMGQINIDMLDIATIYRAAVAYTEQANDELIDRIQGSRVMLRSQAHRPEMRALSAAAAIEIAKPDFKKGGFAPSL